MLRGKSGQERKTMHGSLVPELEAGTDPERKPPGFRTRVPTASAQEQLQAWFNTRICLEEQREQLWEPLFVSVALISWGWYVFWFLRALHEYTIVPWH